MAPFTANADAVAAATVLAEPSADRIASPDNSGPEVTESAHVVERPNRNTPDRVEPGTDGENHWIRRTSDVELRLANGESLWASIEAHDDADAPERAPSYSLDFRGPSRGTAGAPPRLVEFSFCGELDEICEVPALIRVAIARALRQGVLPYSRIARGAPAPVVVRKAEAYDDRMLAGVELAQEVETGRLGFLEITGSSHLRFSGTLRNETGAQFEFDDPVAVLALRESLDAAIAQARADRWLVVPEPAPARVAPAAAKRLERGVYLAPWTDKGAPVVVAIDDAGDLVRTIRVDETVETVEECMREARTTLDGPRPPVVRLPETPRHDDATDGNVYDLRRSSVVYGAIALDGQARELQLELTVAHDGDVPTVFLSATLDAGGRFDASVGGGASPAHLTAYAECLAAVVRRAQRDGLLPAEGADVA